MSEDVSATVDDVRHESVEAIVREIVAEARIAARVEIDEEEIEAWGRRIREAVRRQQAREPRLLGGSLRYGMSYGKGGVAICAEDNGHRYLAWGARQPGGAGPWHGGLEKDGVRVVDILMLSGDRKRMGHLVWAMANCWIWQAKKKKERHRAARARRQAAGSESAGVQSQEGA